MFIYTKNNTKSQDNICLKANVIMTIFAFRQILSDLISAKIISFKSSCPGEAAGHCFLADRKT